MLQLIRFFYPRHVIDWFLYLVIVPATCLCVYWAVFDTRLTASLTGEITTPTVRQGEFLTIQYQVVWNKDCEITAHRFIVDSAGQRYTMDSENRAVREGPEDLRIDVPIPLAGAPGEASYRVQVLSVCNPWQRIFSPHITNIPSRQFLILPGEPAARGLSPASVTCGGERPIRVEAYCRARPNIRRAFLQN